MKIIYSLLLLFVVNPVFSQTFITVDVDTYELITDVNYSTFKNNKLVFKGVTLPDKLTTIKITDFDSISFSRLDYETAGFRKEQLDSIVHLKKSIIYLDEIVLSNTKDNQIVIGEQNRFVKRRARPISNDLNGVVFRNETDTDLRVNKVAIFVNKVKFATQYKINFFKIQESFPINGNQDIKNEELVFSTDTLLLKPGTKGEVEIAITPGYYLQSGDKVLASVQLINYFNDEGNAFLPESNKLTELKFQLSNKTDFYARLINVNTGELSNLRNINLMVNYDFAHRFFKKPHKSIIIAPAILLYAIKEE